MKKLTMTEFKTYCYEQNPTFIYHSKKQNVGKRHRCMKVSQSYNVSTVCLSPAFIGLQNDVGSVIFSGIKSIEYYPPNDDEYYSRINIICSSIDGMEIYTLLAEDKESKIHY